MFDFSRENRSLLANWWRNIDKTILSLILLLFFLGLFFSFSSTSPVIGEKLNKESYFFFLKHLAFVAVVLAVGVIVVFVAMYGFNAVSDFSRICAPWLFTMFICGPLILMPALAESVIGQTFLTSWNDFMHIGSTSVWTGLTQSGEPGIGLLEVIGFSWAANTITHFGLIDMALLSHVTGRRWSAHGTNE